MRVLPHLRVKWRGFFVGTVWVMLATETAFAERPFSAVETANTVEVGQFVAEGGLSVTRFSSQRRETTFDAGLRYGHYRNTELAAFLPYRFAKDVPQTDNQLGDLTLKAKVRFLKGRIANPLSLSGGMVVKIPTAGHSTVLRTSGEADIGFVGIASKDFSQLTAHLNIGYFFMGNAPQVETPNEFRYAVGLDIGARPNMRFIMELAGQTGIEGGGQTGPATLFGGVAYQANPAVLLNATLGIGLNGDAPSYVLGIGASY